MSRRTRDQATTVPRVYIPQHARLIRDELYDVMILSICQPDDASHDKALRAVASALPLTPSEQRAFIQHVQPYQTMSVLGNCQTIRRIRPCRSRLERSVSIVVLRFTHGHADLTVAVHEVWHAWKGVADVIGLRLDDDGANEPSAYYLEWLVKKVVGW